MAAKRSARRAVEPGEPVPGALGEGDLAALLAEVDAVTALEGPLVVSARKVARASRKLWTILARVTDSDLARRNTRAAVVRALDAVAPFVGEAAVLSRLVAVAASATGSLAPLLFEAVARLGPGGRPGARSPRGSKGPRAAREDEARSPLRGRSSHAAADEDARALASARAVLVAFVSGAGGDRTRALALLAALLAPDDSPAVWGEGLRRAVATFGSEPFRALASLILGDGPELRGSSAFLVEDRLTAAAGAFATSHEVVRALGQVVESEARSGDPYPRRALLIVRAIAGAPPPLAFPELDRLRLKVRHRSVKRALEKALGLVAAATGSSRQELEDSSVPTFALDASGRRAFPDEDLELRLDERGGATWIPLDGARRAKPTPALRRIQKALAGTVAAQRARLEQAMVDERSWALGAWKASFLAHPILANLARRVLWRVTPASQGDAPVVAFVRDGRLETLDGSPLEAPDDAGVHVAHPLQLEPATLALARARCVELGLVQPWKQLFRETYAPLAAERARGECDRFRDQVVAHRNLYALTRGRGWRGLACIAFGTFEGERPFAQGVTATLDVALATGADPFDAGRGIRLGSLAFTKRVGEDRAPVELGQVPPIVFSEACRDLDLVVGVASLGEDADFVSWLEARARGEGSEPFPVPEHSERALAATAQVRAALLERVLPALGLGSRVQLDGRHARIQGELHEYRVHLGTGHAYVEPGGRFLVFSRRSREAAPELYLPEEAATDPQAREVVARILTLAADRLVSDPELLRQLEEG